MVFKFTIMCHLVLSFQGVHDNPVNVFALNQEKNLYDDKLDHAPNTQENSDESAIDVEESSYISMKVTYVT